MEKIRLTAEQRLWLKAKGKLRVYVSAAGIRYHRQACVALRHSKHPIPLYEAIWHGFLPCGVCNPPELGIPGRGN